MKTIVKIVANKETNVVVKMKTITDSKTQETRQVGSVMVQSKTLTGLDRIGRVSVRTAFLTLELPVLELLDDYLVDGAEFPYPGQIVVEETLTPYITAKGKKQDAKINPTSKQVITFQGKPVYRNSYFTTDMSVKDIFLKDAPSGVANTLEGSVNAEE